MYRFLPALIVLLLIIVIGGGLSVFDRDPVAEEASSLLAGDPVRASGTGSAAPGDRVSPGRLSPAVHNGESPSINGGIDLQQAMRWDGDDLPVETRPDGAQVLHLGGRFTHVSAAVRTRDGEWVIQCFSGYAAIEEGLTRGIPGKDPMRTNHETVSR
jgi:hypothetical protein